MLVYFNEDNALCQWDNKEHMVCNYANQVFASVIFFGAFSTNNMFNLYSVLPWCFLIGAILGLSCVLAEKAAPCTRRYIQARICEKQYLSFYQYFWQPAASVFNCLNPAVALSGALHWAGNNNLTCATLGIYIAWFFQFFLKRRYAAWWGKYAYLIFAGLNVGVAIPVSSSHLSSALVLVKTCPPIGGVTMLLSGVSTGSYKTTMPPSYLYQLRATLVSHRTSILLSGEV